MINVICVKWGTKYGPEWVFRLRAMVEKHLSTPHRFICMTDNPIDPDDWNYPPVECIPCPEGMPGWWAKVGLFEPGKFQGANLYLDLDVVITGNIDGLLNEYRTGVVVAPDDFSYSLVNPKQGIGGDTQRLLGGVGTINSSVMLWHDDAGRDVWDKFMPEKMQEVHGDQNWITQALWPEKMELLPERWVCSYKYHVMRGIPARPIVVFHGEPKVTDLPKSDPLHQAWAA